MSASSYGSMCETVDVTGTAHEFFIRRTDPNGPANVAHLNF